MGSEQTIGTVADAVGVGKAVEAAKNIVGKVTASASGGAAAVAPASDFEYGLTDEQEGVRIQKHTGKGGNIIVPDTIEGFPVIEMANGVFFGTTVTSVVLPDSVTLFDFSNSKQLQTVTFPKGITKIPSCFILCTALTSITIPDTVTEIDRDAFAMSGLTSIVIPEGVTVIGGNAFISCENLTSLTLPESIQVVDDGAFSNCTSLETVNLPSHQFDISAGVFEGCPKLNIATQKAIRDAGYTGSF